MIETDCPFMTPDNGAQLVQGGRNEPCSLPAVVKVIARCYGVEPDEIAAATTANARRVFGLQLQTKCTSENP